MSGTRSEGPNRRHRLLVAVYWGSAAFLAPWIIALYLEQPPRGYGYHLRVVTLGISLLMVGGMAATGVLAHRRNPATILGATFTATLAFISAWFMTVTTTGRTFWLVLGYALLVQLPVVALCSWAARYLLSCRGEGSGLPGWVPASLIVTAIVLVPLAVLGSHATMPVRAVYHLRVVWTGLDILELAGMLTTGWALRRGSPGVAVTAMVTSTLLFCDAWFNILATTGSVQRAAITMAFGELPLSVISAIVATREVSTWRRARRRKALAAPG